MDVNRVGQGADVLLQQTQTAQRNVALRREAANQEDRAVADDERKTQEASGPKPVLNAEGQVTGTRINTTA